MNCNKETKICQEDQPDQLLQISEIWPNPLESVQGFFSQAAQNINVIAASLHFFLQNPVCNWEKDKNKNLQEQSPCRP